MTTRLLDIINTATQTKKYTPASDICYFRDQLKRIQNVMTDKESINVDALIRLMSSKRNPTSKKQLDKIRGPLINIVNKYEKYFSEDNEEDDYDSSSGEVSISNEDGEINELSVSNEASTSDECITIEDLEASLKEVKSKRNKLTTNEKIKNTILVEKAIDKTVSLYNNISATKPMEYVTLVKIKSRYKYRAHNESFKLLYDTLEEACEAIMEDSNKHLVAKYGNNVKVEDIIVPNDVPKRFFTYDSHNFVCYWYENTIFFDIRHIVPTLKKILHKNSISYNNCLKHVTRYLWYKNDYSGYNLRELINEKTFYEIILACKAGTSETVRLDIGRIIRAVRNNEFIIDDQLLHQVLNPIPKSNTHDDLIKILDTGIVPYDYDNPDHLIYAQYLVSKGAYCDITKYINRKVLYAILLVLKNPSNTKIIIKFGYSKDILGRFMQLKNEYNCDIFFIDAKIINSEKEETVFHNQLKAKYDDLIKSHTIYRYKKTEIYYLNPVLMKDFDDYPCRHDDDDEIVYDLDKHQLTIIGNIKRQNITFAELIENNGHGKPSNKFCDYLIIKENNNYTKPVIYDYDKEKYLADRRVECLQLKIRLKELQCKQ